MMCSCAPWIPRARVYNPVLQVIFLSSLHWHTTTCLGFPMNPIQQENICLEFKANAKVRDTQRINCMWFPLFSLCSLLPLWKTLQSSVPFCETPPFLISFGSGMHLWSNSTDRALQRYWWVVSMGGESREKSGFNRIPIYKWFSLWVWLLVSSDAQICLRVLGKTFFVLFWWCWGLMSGLRTCEAGTLLLDTCLRSLTGHMARMNMPFLWYLRSICTLLNLHIYTHTQWSMIWPKRRIKFSRKWMELETILLSQTQKQTSHCFVSYTESRIKKKNDLRVVEGC